MVRHLASVSVGSPARGSLGLVSTVLMLVAGCHPSVADDYDIKPPGGDNPIVTPGGIDAAMPDGNDAMPGIVGRACLVVDLRNLAACSATGAGGLTVTLGTETATTAADGTFTMPTPAGTNLTWRVAGGAIVPSVMSFGAVPTIPIVGTTTYEDLLVTNGLILIAGQGSVVVRVVRAGAPLTGATAISTAATPPIYAPYYDGNSASAWDQDATGGFGVVWIPGAAAGTLDVAVTPPLGSTATTTATVEDQAITFATLDVP